MNFLDTAELYPVPTTAAGYRWGLTEEIIGRWLRKQDASLRQKLVIATKISGYSRRKLGRSKGGLAKEDVHKAIDESRARLGVDCIDLYQVHWPSRYVPMFGDARYRPEREREGMSEIRDTLLGLKDALDAEKIKHYGLCNETTYGLCTWIRLADEMAVPRPVSIQNSFSLLDRAFETELAEACAPSNYNIPLMPWSVLGGGVLSGKYIKRVSSTQNRVDSAIEKARYSLYPKFQPRFISKRSLDAVEKYGEVAKEAGLSPATMAQAWCKTRFFILSTMIGATTMQQLKENIDAVEKVKLSKEIIAAIDAVHNASPNPVLIL